MPPTRTSRALLLASLLALPAPALAQDSQYWDIQYGPVGQLLGGQVVGSARDLSASYYNPGGLALAESPDFLLSVQGFSLRRLSMKPVDSAYLAGASKTDFAAFPGFVAFAFPKGWFGDRTRMAFSLLTRQQLVARIDQRSVGSTPAGDGRQGLEALFDQSLREVWGGLTLSHRFSDRLGLGATLYGVHRGQRTRLEQSLQITRPPDVGVAALIIDDFDYRHERMLGKVGLAWERGGTSLGLAVTTPSLALFGSGNAGFTRSAVGADLDGDGQTDALLLDGLDEGLDSNYKSSWAIAGGAAWRHGSLQIHASGEWFAPVDSYTVLQGAAQSSNAAPIVLTQDLDSVFNAGLAVEYWLGGVSADLAATSRGTALYGSFRTDFTASPGVPANEISSSNQDIYHLTAGTAFSVGSSRFSLGVQYSHGRRDRGAVFPGLRGVPVIGQDRAVETHITRWVFVVGYLFTSK